LVRNDKNLRKQDKSRNRLIRRVVSELMMRPLGERNDANKLKRRNADFALDSALDYLCGVLHYGAVMSSLIAHTAMSKRSITIGILVCIGLVAGLLFVIGGYTILASLIYR